MLDWLAVEFVKQGWSLKKLHKLIVMSQTYKQASHRSDQSDQSDLENTLLSHGARFRLDAEIIRDSALKAAGVLSLKMGGPGVYPPQPASVTTEGTQPVLPDERDRVLLGLSAPSCPGKDHGFMSDGETLAERLKRRAPRLVEEEVHIASGRLGLLAACVSPGGP